MAASRWCCSREWFFVLVLEVVQESLVEVRGQGSRLSCWLTGGGFLTPDSSTSTSTLKLHRLDRRGESFTGKLFNVKFGPFEPGDKDDGSTLMVSFPHLVGCLGTREASEFHHAADDEHEVNRGIAMKHDLVTGQVFRSALRGGRSKWDWLMGKPPRPHGLEMNAKVRSNHIIRPGYDSTTGKGRSERAVRGWRVKTPRRDAKCVD
jgi:hypothetical protein